MVRSASVTQWKLPFWPSEAVWGAGRNPFHYFFSTRPCAAPAAVAPLALGMTVPAAPRLLIAAPRRAQRFASGEAAAVRSAVLLSAIAARADEHLALAPRTQNQSGIVHRSPRRGGLDDPRSPGNTSLGAVRKCGSGRSLGRDRQVNTVRGCVGLLAESDLTPTPERRHRGYAPRRRVLIGHIGSGGKQRQLSGGGAGTTQSMFTPLRQILLRRAVHRISALSRSHQHGDPLAFHPFESFDSPLGFLRSRSLQRRDQRGGVEPLSMVVIDSDELLEGPVHLAGVTGRQCIDQSVDRRSLRTVDEEVELVVLPRVAKPGAQQRIQPGIGRRDQGGSGVVLPAMMHVWLGGQTEHSGAMRQMLAELGEEVRRLDERVRSFDLRLNEISREILACQRLLCTPGFGPIVATALVASVADASTFRNGRELAAWVGVVPRQRSTGGRTVLLGISKRGDKYLRSQVIHGARAALRTAARREDRRSRWALEVERRRGKNIAIVALANKNLRTTWALLTQEVEYQANVA